MEKKKKVWQKERVPPLMLSRVLAMTRFLISHSQKGKAGFSLVFFPCRGFLARIWLCSSQNEEHELMMVIWYF